MGVLAVSEGARWANRTKCGVNCVMRVLAAHRAQGISYLAHGSVCPANAFAYRKHAHGYRAICSTLTSKNTVFKQPLSR